MYRSTCTSKYECKLSLFLVRVYTILADSLYIFVPISSIFYRQTHISWWTRSSRFGVIQKPKISFGANHLSQRLHQLYVINAILPLTAENARFQSHIFSRECT